MRTSTTLHESVVAWASSTHRISKAKKGKRVHACEFLGCGKVFTRSEHKRRHELNHQQAASFRCDRPGCQKSFPRIDLLKRHSERHDYSVNGYDDCVNRPIISSSRSICSSWVPTTELTTAMMGIETIPWECYYGPDIYKSTESDRGLSPLPCVSRNLLYKRPSGASDDSGIDMSYQSDLHDLIHFSELDSSASALVSKARSRQSFALSPERSARGSPEIAPESANIFEFEVVHGNVLDPLVKSEGEPRTYTSSDSGYGSARTSLFLQSDHPWVSTEAEGTVREDHSLIEPEKEIELPPTIVQRSPLGFNERAANPADYEFASDGEQSFVEDCRSESPIYEIKPPQIHSYERIKVSLLRFVTTAYLSHISNPSEATSHGAGSKNSSSPPASTNAETSSSQTSVTRSSSSLKRRSRDEYEEVEDFDDQDCSRKRRKTSDAPAQDMDGRLLACPYAKFDPTRYSERNLTEMRYRGCSSCYLTTIPRLKQHLYRIHRRPDQYCPCCFQVFDKQTLLDEHNRRRDCVVSDSPFDEKMDATQMRQIKRRTPGKDRAEVWFSIYRILFPDAKVPTSPFADDISPEFAQNYLAFFEREAPSRLSAIIMQEASNHGALALSLEQNIILEDVLEESIGVLVRELGQGIEPIQVENPFALPSVNTLGVQEPTVVEPNTNQRAYQNQPSFDPFSDPQFQANLGSQNPACLADPSWAFFHSQTYTNGQDHVLAHANDFETFFEQHVPVETTTYSTLPHS